MDNFSRLGIRKIAILDGTNNIARRDSPTHQPEEFSDKMKDLVEMYKNEGFQVGGGTAKKKSKRSTGNTKR